jgi:uncharacterized SAM-binding protein YcdF (DUF218 family)
MYKKNVILFALLVSSLASCYMLFYFKYDFQNILLSEFDYKKIPNLITILVFLAIAVLIVFNMLSSEEYRTGGLIFILILSVAGFVSLLISNNIADKEEKIILCSAFLGITIYNCCQLLFLLLSKSKKIHFFSGLWTTILIVIVIIGTTFYKVYQFRDDSELYAAGNRKSDAGVILGAAVWGGNRPSPILRERINKGYEIYEKKYVSKLVLTGGGSPAELTEGEVEKNELKKYGVEIKDLIVEDKSNSTFEQILYVRDKVYNKNKWTRVILVSDDFHLFRASEICKFNNINTDCIATDTPRTMEGAINNCLKETGAVIFYWIFGIG